MYDIVHVLSVQVQSKYKIIPGMRYYAADWTGILGRTIMEIVAVHPTPLESPEVELLYKNECIDARSRSNNTTVVCAPWRDICSSMLRAAAAPVCRMTLKRAASISVRIQQYSGL